MKHESKKFIFLMAFLMSLVALSIDTMLPALSQIQKSLNIEKANDTQAIISFVFLGMILGFLTYGPLSDSIGRKKPLYIGIAIFILGSFISFFSKSLDVMLFGRFLQGLGASASRVITVSMVRDLYRGEKMAKIMSFIIIIFIIVPAVAPVLGQIILNILDWRFIFLLFIVLGFVALILLKIDVEETLKVENRIKFSFKNTLNGITETAKDKNAVVYTLTSGLIFGSFVGYLNSSQQILQIQYNLGKMFPVYFGSLAVFLGLSSYLNSIYVEKYGMLRLSVLSLIVLTVISGIYLLLLFMFGGETPLYLLLLYLGINFLFFGFLFGNLNTLAIDNLGHIAGVANSVISSVQIFISVLIGSIVGMMYEGDVYPLTFGFLSMSTLCLIIILKSNEKNPLTAS